MSDADTPVGRLVRIERGEPFATVLIDRPEKLNALNSVVRGELIEALDELSADDGVKVVILAGSGDQAFAAGADVAEFHERTDAEQREVMEGRGLYEVVASFPKPTIAAIAGYCLGGGSELALACDVRVADRTARLGQPEIRLGIIPGGGATQRLARMVGPGQAYRICLSGDALDAEEAHRIGWVELLVEAGRHLEAARELAGRIARWSPRTLRLVKRAIRASQEVPLSRGLELERELFLEAFASEDGRAGVRAFLEKRERE